MSWRKGRAAKIAGISHDGNASGRVNEVPPISRGVAGYRRIALVVATALFMQQLDGTVLTIALPTMARDLGAAATNLSLALTSYLLALALFIPASGNLADRFGARTIFCGAIGLFLAGSLACAQAGSLWQLVGARFLQGMGGAMMVPVGRLVLMRSVAKSDTLQALSWLVIPALIGPILGPPLGGLIVTWLDWRWIFYLNLPIGLIGMVCGLVMIPNFRGDISSRFDKCGFVLSGGALGCLLFGFELASRAETGGTAAVLVFSGIGLGAVYIRYARSARDPILDPALMRISTFRLSVIAGSLTRITQGAQSFLLPLMLQLAFGLSAAVTGSITVAGALGGLAMKALAPRILRRWGFRVSLTFSGVFGTGGYALCATFRPDWPTAGMVIVIAISGFFTSLQFTGYNAIAYADIRKEDLSGATTFYATFQQLTLSLGICLSATALEFGQALSNRTELTVTDFIGAFLLVTAISASAIIWNQKIEPNAGASISGHRQHD